MVMMIMMMVLRQLRHGRQDYHPTDHARSADEDFTMKVTICKAGTLTTPPTTPGVQKRVLHVKAEMQSEAKHCDPEISLMHPGA
jgi:hypothetical protein